MISTEQIFTLFFIMLGPLHLLVPFNRATTELNPTQIRKLSVKSSALAGVFILIGGFLGTILLTKWKIEAPIMLLAGGIIFFLAALKPLITVATERPTDLLVKPSDAALVALKMIITPYGLAAFIVLLAESRDLSRTITILACMLVVMFLNALVMTFGKSMIIRGGGKVMPVLIMALGVLQLALALELIYQSIILLIK
jgi:multiple antibiotic resistance protein